MPHPDHHHDDEASRSIPPVIDAAGQQPEGAWPQTAWGWACWVALLLGGQAVLLVTTTWTLATALSNGWVLPVLLALGLLGRLVPDTLRLAQWACSAQSWTPPVDQHIHLGIAITALGLAVLAAIAT
jgi:hypothetical protein